MAQFVSQQLFQLGASRRTLTHVLAYPIPRLPIRLYRLVHIRNLQFGVLQQLVQAVKLGLHLISPIVEYTKVKHGATIGSIVILLLHSTFSLQISKLRFEFSKFVPHSL